MNEAIDEVSRSALLHAASFSDEAAGQLTNRLYRYNRLPLTPRIRRRFPDPVAVEDYLVGGGSGSLALRRWRRTPIIEGYECWMILRRGGRRERATHKLYVAVGIDHVRDALHDAAEAAVAAGVGTLKVGVTADALVRPDKLIVYAAGREQLEAVAARLEPRLRGATPQLVPFTAATECGGPLSWGMDPPEPQRTEGPSWRVLVCRRLGIALAGAAGTPGERASAAALSLAEQGIDPATWTLRDGWDAIGEAA
ncbi:MAG: hypothetical protein U0R50_16675 [Gaiellales bacterium]